MSGRCHICQDVREVKYCGRCRHWFCEDCRTKYWWRGWGWIKEHLLGDAQPECCGPVTEQPN